MKHRIIEVKEGGFGRRLCLAEDGKGGKVLLEALEMEISWKELGLIQDLRETTSRFAGEESNESLLTYQGITRINEDTYLILPYHQQLWENWTLRKEEKMTLEEIASAGRVMIEVLGSLRDQEENLQGFFFTDLAWTGEEWVVLDPRARRIVTPYRSNEGLFKYFAPPEIIKGSGWTVSANLYTIGMSLYYLTTRVFPFPLENQGETMTAIIKEDPADPRVYRPDLGAAPAGLLMNLLRKNPKERLSVEKSLALIDKILTEGDVKALPAEEEEYSQIGETVLRRRERKRSLVRWGQRLRWPTVIIGAMVALVVLFGRNGYQEVITEDTPPQMVVSYFYQALVELDGMKLEETLAKGVGSEYSMLVTNFYVISKMREVYEGIDFSFIEIQDLRIQEAEESNKETPVFIGEYIFKVLEGQEYRWQERRDQMVLGRQKNRWKIISLETQVFTEEKQPLPETEHDGAAPYLQTLTGS